MKKLLSILVLFAAGCASDCYDVEAEYRPLEQICEKPAMVKNVGSSTSISTVGEKAYVKDLEDWLQRHPPGSAKYKGVLRHEQEHAKRQLDRGVLGWLFKYSIDPKFALEEEQIGFYYEITTRRANGEIIRPENYAKVLSDYKTIFGGKRLISFEDALAWVRDVIAGRWSPN